MLLTILNVLLVIAGLAVFEIVNSLDNAVINASILKQMNSAKARHFFVTWGMFFSVGLVRGILPLLIYYVPNAGMGFGNAMKAFWSGDPHVTQAVQQSGPAVLNLPGISGLIHHTADTLVGYGKILNEVDSITKELQTARQTLLSDNQSLNALYESNLTIFQQLQVWIEVCRIKRENLETVVIPEARISVGNSKDSIAAQRLSDLIAMRERLDKHMHDLELTAMIRLQTAPKIRITQGGNLKLADKLESSVLNTIPLWKDNLALLITQQRQKEAAALEDQVDDTTNGLLRSSADMLHDNAVQIAKQGNRGVVDIATLQHTQEQLLKTIDETQQIAAQASKDREVARQQLAGMTNELKEKLASAAGF